MIRIRMDIKNIDYITLLEISMPYLEKWLDERDNLLFDMIAKLVSNHGKPSKFSSFLVSLVPNKDHMVVSILPRFHDSIKKAINEIMVKNDIIALITFVNTKSIERDGKTMIRIELEIDQIDYITSAEKVLPKVIENLSLKEERAGRLGRMLLNMKETPVNVIRAAMSAIPKEQRDKLFTAILMEYKEELVSGLNGLISENNVKAQISNIQINSMKESFNK